MRETDQDEVEGDEKQPDVVEVEAASPPRKKATQSNFLFTLPPIFSAAFGRTLDHSSLPISRSPIFAPVLAYLL